MRCKVMLSEELGMGILHEKSAWAGWTCETLLQSNMKTYKIFSEQELD
jgi:hypothetical protein